MRATHRLHRSRRSRRRAAVGLVLGLAVLATSGAAGTSYTVRRGDTLSGIASRHGVPVAALAGANGLSNPNRVIAGTTLVIPSAPAAAPAAATHLVQTGETLSAIAARHGVSISALAGANGLANPNRVVAGRTLTIPAGSAVATASPVPATSPYTVRTGDTVGAIARRFGVSADALAGANGIADVRRLQVGVVLAVPGGAPSTAAPATTSSAGIDASRLPARLVASPSRMALIPSFAQWSSAYGVPLDLLMAMTWYESGWRNDAVSSAGARGIGQLLPSTVVWLETSVMGIDLDPGVPDDNVRMSARYLAWLLERTGGDASTALGGYYQGLRSVRAVGFYGETEVYVAGVLAVRDRYF